MDDEHTWLDEFHDEMKAVCEEKKRRTHGKCEEYECLSVGWCSECLAIPREVYER